MALQNSQADEQRNSRWDRLSLVAMAVVFGILVSANVLLSLIFSGVFSGTTLTDPQGNIIVAPTATVEITAEPTVAPTGEPTVEPTAAPTAEPTAAPTAEPTAAPSAEPTAAPTAEPTQDTGAKGLLPTMGSGPGKGVTSLRQYIAVGFLALSGFALVGTALLVRRRV